MKFSLLSYQIAKSWDLDTMIEKAKKHGFAALEFRAEYDQSHGVELETTLEQRRAIRQRIQAAYLEVAGVSCSQRFESTDPRVRAEAVERSKGFADLAADLEAGWVRVCGNTIPDGVDKDTAVAYVAESLAEVADHCAGRGVDLLLEMHGEFNNWNYCLKALELAGRDNIGLLYNSDVRDLVYGSIEPTFDRVKHLIRHVHLHDLASGYPYEELLGLLRASGFDGYVSPEILVEIPTPEDYLALYRAHLHRLTR
ncbi:sugar phosphate isomerase/epimerase family protein [Streptosporangium sp. NPDC051022]|uniref:sugar phosphate isomerase/epimerase family protein n=1 Tax=Streptosporangium sp. NPDC051022 TaxID=3155752 RepID=UPI003418EC56